LTRTRELLAPDVDFRALTPDKFWEASSASEVVDDVILGRWLEPTDRIDALEQPAYFTVADGRIAWLRIMCSGFRDPGAIEA
jgi:hypothetical protein